MDILLWAVTGLAFCACRADFFRTYLVKKRKEWYYDLLAWGLFLVFQFTVMWYVNDPIGTITCNSITLLCVVCFLYQEKIQTKILAVMLNQLLGGAAEMVVVYAALANGVVIEDAHQIYAIMANLVYWMFIRIGSLFIKGKIEDGDRKSYGITLSIVLGVNLLMELFLVKLNAFIKMKQVYYWCVLFSALMMILDIVFFKAFMQLMNQQKIKRERELFARQLELCEVQMQERMAMMEDTRRVRHDMKNQIIYVQSLLENGESQKAQKFLNEFMDENLNNKSEIAKSGNIIVDSILNSKYIVAKNRDISMDADLQIPAQLNYKAADLCIILGNLMENAIEGAHKAKEDKKITIQMKFSHQKLFLKIQNSCNGIYQIAKDGTFLTTKTDAVNHGVGLHSVQRVLDDYGGFMEISGDPDRFSVRVYL